MSERLGFSSAMRVRLDRDFRRAYDLRVRRDLTFAMLLVAPNQLLHARLGISISRRVGSAACRNRIKRLLREAFRLEQKMMTAGVDYIVQVRPHQPNTLEVYRAALLKHAAIAGDLALKAQDRRRNHPTDDIGSLGGA